MKKRRITAEGFLRLLGDVGSDFMPLTKRETMRKFFQEDYKIKSWDDYFPFSIESVSKKLVRKGWVEIRETDKGKQVIITEKGKKQALVYDLEKLKVKSGSWDGQWRMIFFDIEELQRRKRDELRKYLKQLGLMQMQESVWISPWEVRDEIKYLREILDVADGVKWGLLSEIENSEELKEWFKLK